MEASASFETSDSRPMKQLSYLVPLNFIQSRPVACNFSEVCDEQALPPLEELFFANKL